MDVPVIRFPTITMMVRVIGVLVAAFVLIWTFHFRGGLALSSDNKSLIFNVKKTLKFYSQSAIVFLILVF